VTPVSFSRVSAFGALNVPRKEVVKDLQSALCRARADALKVGTPNLGFKFPIDRLRKRIAHAMRIDVIFTPRVISEFRNSHWPNSRLPVRKVWEKHPVWKVGPNSHYRKANRLCSLLHYVAIAGWKANILHLLVQLATHVWRLSWRDFTGLCRKIVSKIRAGSEIQKRSPEPLERFGALTKNPILNDREYRIRPDRRRGIAPRFKPKLLDLLVLKLEDRQKRLDAKRHSVVTTRY